jgi:uncharacterized protein YkwD
LNTHEAEIVTLKNYMRILLTSIIFLLCQVLLTGQSGVWEQWDPEVVRYANTASEKKYLNEEEKKVILFMNLARIDGDLFANTFLEQYLDENNSKRTNFVKSLYRDLNKITGLPVLLPEEDLTAVAQEHATLSGQNGYTGHGKFKERFEPLMGNPYQQVGENCSYGYTRAIDIVITLLIDEGIKGVGHRKNILNEEFNSTGIAIRPHTKFRTNCVIDFGKKVRSDLNDVPY